MKIFGHDWIESDKFYKISTIEEIAKTPSNSLLLLEPLRKSLEVAKYCKNNILPYVLEISSIEEALFANLLNATYVVCKKELVKELMPIAQHYLFDTQVLATINKNEIEEMAKIGVDGVVIV